MASKKLEFMYTNWSGETRLRSVEPISIWYGSTAFHKEPQWILEARDLEKNEIRNFAMRDIQGIS